MEKLSRSRLDQILKTAEQILSEANCSEIELIEILEFMEDQGIIKLEKPDSGKNKKVSNDAFLENTFYKTK